jgi:uncharacterized protein YutE (UPF0331/DUF86 family)
MPIEPDNVVLNKAAIIERSLKRMREEFRYNPELDNHTHLDALILNIERACQAAIDMAQHLVAVNHYGMPQNSSDAFILLEKAEVISGETTRSMIGMTGFRNVAIHEYQDLDLKIVRAIVEDKYKALIALCREMGVRVIVD